MADLFTNVRPGRAHRKPSPTGLVHDGQSWIPADQHRPLQALALAPIPSAVPEGFDPRRPTDWREYEGPAEMGDGLGGFLRAVPQDAADQVLDDEYLLAGEELYRSLDGQFDVVPLEGEDEAARRRRLLLVLRKHELEPSWR